MALPHCHPHLWPKGIPEGRYASRVRTEPEGCAVALVGLADDEGVRLNNGRVGALEGPKAFRDALSKYGVSHVEAADLPLLWDVGDVHPGMNLLDTHRRVGEVVSAVLDRGIFPVGIGGGHDLSLPLIRTAAAAHGPLTVIYFDAHLDVRETQGSGMAFRRLIEDTAATELHLFGFNPFSNSREHLRFFREHRGFIHDIALFNPDLWRDASNLAVSVDLDVLDAAFAPGVSALNPCGLCPSHLAGPLRALGRDPRVRCFDIMELNPLHDQEGRTAKVAAHLFLCFLCGFAERGA
jgi:formimidoylglutamase